MTAIAVRSLEWLRPWLGSHVVRLEPLRQKHRLGSGNRIEQHLRRDGRALRIIDLLPPLRAEQHGLAVERAIERRGENPRLQNAALEDDAVGVAEAIPRAGVLLARLAVGAEVVGKLPAFGDLLDHLGPHARSGGPR